MDFQRLNYTLANEDSAVDRRLCGRAGMRLAAIAGSGSRIVSLLATQPRSIQAIDLSREQILLTELRLATLSRLECDEYRAFWGFPNDVYVDLDQRTVLRGLDLSEECRRYAIQLLQMSEDRPLIYLGRWEQTMARLSRPISAVVGKKLLDLWWDGADFGDAIQKLGSAAELRIHAVTRLFGNAQVFGAMMYRKQFPVLNLCHSNPVFYRKLLQRAFAASPLPQNFFLQMLFCGRIRTANALPDEVQEGVYNNAKRALQRTEVDLATSSIFGLNAVRDGEAWDGVFLSDVPSYLTSASMTTLVQYLSAGLSADGFISARYYRYQPEIDQSVVRCIDPVCEEIASSEKTGAYSMDVIKPHLAREMVLQKKLQGEERYEAIG